MHIHFTGSLPWDNIIQRLKPVDFPSLVNDWKLYDSNFFDFDLSKWFENVSTSSTKALSSLYSYRESILKEGYEGFENIYALIQTISRPNHYLDYYEFYSNGAFQIACRQGEFGVNKYAIIAGPKINIEHSTLRFNAMINGMKTYERTNPSIRGFIRMTFISKNERLINLSYNSIYKLFSLIESNTEIQNRLVGFDFSGDELSTMKSNIWDYLEILQNYNSFRRKIGKKTIPISVHCGENTTLNNEMQLNFMLRLMNYTLSSLGHGTILWIKDLIDINEKGLYMHKLEILHKLKERKILVEVCPSANILLSPELKRGNKINLDVLKTYMVRYSINTDNCEIFDTNIRKEKRLIE